MLCGYGGMAEWLIAPVLKTGGPQGLGGSNPSPSAMCGHNGLECFKGILMRARLICSLLVAAMSANQLKERR